MLHTITIDHPAHLIFTVDFHELVRGKLDCGTRCTIAYDPRRIVPAGDPYVFGDPNRPVIAHIQFDDDDPVLDVELRSRVGIQFNPTFSLKGEGAMLEGEFQIPDKVSKMAIWFTFAGIEGHTYFDSELGRNFIFRFLHEDFQLLRAAVFGNDGDPLHRFLVTVEADQRIERIVVRYRVTNAPGWEAEKEADLHPTDRHATDGCVIWEVEDILVPIKAVVAFDLRYLIEGHWIGADNQGNYYLATHPETLAQVRL